MSAQPETNSKVPALVKLTVMLGALAGTTAAVIQNREKILEAAEYYLQKGADFCRELQQEKPIYATEVEDAGFARSLGARHHDTDDEMTTPDPLDGEDDDATDYDLD